VNNYVINPSQELIALGVTNVFGPFFGAYPATGSFSRTAIKAKTGVRTPIAGLITGIVVLLALYALPPVFFYIPNASLSAVIIHAVLDLITSPNTVYGFWRVNPLEAIIFFTGVFVTIFSSIENGIYVTVAVSGGLMLWRIAKAHGDFLGKIKVQTIETAEGRNLFLPFNGRDGHNPNLPIGQPYPGVFIFRFTESFLYPNANHYTDALVTHVFASTKRAAPDQASRPGDRPWNDPKPRTIGSTDDPRPVLKAIIFDCTSITNADVSAIQVLVDVRKQLERHAEPNPLEFHFAAVRSPWTRRAFSAAGFGYIGANARPVFSFAEVNSGNFTGDNLNNTVEVKPTDDVERPRPIPVTGLNFSAFHADLDEAYSAVLINLGVKDVEPSRSRSPLLTPPNGVSSDDKDISFAAPPSLPDASKGSNLSG